MNITWIRELERRSLAEQDNFIMQFWTSPLTNPSDQEERPEPASVVQHSDLFAGPLELVCTTTCTLWELHHHVNQSIVYNYSGCRIILAGALLTRRRRSSRRGQAFQTASCTGSALFVTTVTRSINMCSLYYNIFSMLLRLAVAWREYLIQQL